MLEHMFSQIDPEKYMLLNRILTFFQDTRWRSGVAAELLRDGPGSVLDLCCGPGDLSFSLARELWKKGEDAHRIIGLDFCDKFLQFARRRAATEGYAIRWIKGDAAALPFHDQSIDSIGITFSFRNLIYMNPRKDSHLEEISRVLARRGKLVIAETGQPHNVLMRRLFHLYLTVFVSAVGGLVSGNTTAYRYLAESARNFVDSTGMQALLHDAGFGEVRTQHFLFGAVTLYVAKR